MPKFEAPIPGQSLTTTPKNAPYERPPEIVDPEEALQVHLARLNEEEAMEAVFNFLDMGVDLQSLVEGITRSAVMQGIHTVDVSMIIAPVIHEFIKGNAMAAGVEFDEGFEDKEKEKELSYKRNKMLAKKELAKMGIENVDASINKEKEEPMEVAEEVVEKTSNPPKGLMARRS